MPNVLYLLNFAGKAGTERYVETLVRRLGGAGITPFFAYNIEGGLAARMEELGVPVRRLEMRSPFDLHAAGMLAGLCREWDIDLIHTHYLRENYVAMLAKGRCRGVKVVYTNHFIMVNNAVTRLTNRLLASRQDQIIAVSNASREQMIANGWSPKKITRIFNGVDAAAWAGAREESTLRRELDIPPDRFTMVSAGRFSHEKGQDVFLRALRALKERTRRPFTAVLTGEGEELEPCRALARELGLTEEEVRFTGFRQDMKNVYGGGDLYVNPSRNEALSYGIQEAMACGLPVVATDAGGPRDIIPRREDGGVLVPCEDPEAMAEAILPFAEDHELARTLGLRAAETIRTRFDVDTMCGQTLQVYEKVCAAGTRREKKA